MTNECEGRNVGLSALLGEQTPDPEMAVWVDGKPDNIEAAAADAYEWLLFFKSITNNIQMSDANCERLDLCIVALRSFMWPNAN